MRVTIDADCGMLQLAFKIFKGIVITHKFPDEIEKSKRGYHLIWHGLNIDFKKHFVYRYLIGDDKNRIKLDMNQKRIGQVLFTSKKVFIRRNGFFKPVKYCRICSTPLTQFWVYRNGNYYCINCGIKNVEVEERKIRAREKIFHSLLSRISLFTDLREMGGR